MQGMTCNKVACSMVQVRVWILQSCKRWPRWWPRAVVPAAKPCEQRGSRCSLLLHTLAVSHVEHLHEYTVMVWAVICLPYQSKAESLLRLFRHCLLRLNLLGFSQRHLCVPKICGYCCSYVYVSMCQGSSVSSTICIIYRINSWNIALHVVMHSVHVHCVKSHTFCDSGDGADGEGYGAVVAH